MKFSLSFWSKNWWVHSKLWFFFLCEFDWNINDTETCRYIFFLHHFSKLIQEKFQWFCTRRFWQSTNAWAAPNYISSSLCVLAHSGFLWVSAAIICSAHNFTQGSYWHAQYLPQMSCLRLSNGSNSEPVAKVLGKIIPCSSLAIFNPFKLWYFFLFLPAI